MNQGLTAPSDPQRLTPCISGVHQYNIYYIAQNQGAGPLSIKTLTGGCPQIPEGPVEAWG